MSLENSAIHSNATSATDQWKEGFSYYLSFFFWPFGVTIAALRHWDKPWSKNVFWLFCVFFGFTFIIAEAGGADSDRYARLFLHYAHSRLSLSELWASFYSETSNTLDIASPLITFLVSRISYNPRILFMVFGLIFGYFYSRNIWYILEKVNGRITFLAFIFLLAFALLNPVWNINGFRFWTATHIFLFGALPYLLEGNKKRLIWVGFSAFFHFSFLFPIFIFLGFIIVKNRLNIFMGFFILTAFLKEIDLLQVRSYLLMLPDIFHTKIINYTNPQYAEAISIAELRNNWYLSFSENSIRWVIYALITFIYFFGRSNLKEYKNLKTLMCFSLLLYGFANLASLMPSGGRFITIASMFMFALFILVFYTLSKMKGLMLMGIISLPFIFLFLVVSIRTGFDFYGLITIFGNPVLAALPAESVPLINWFKRLL